MFTTQSLCLFSSQTPGLGLCYLLDFRKADLRCGAAISWAFTFFFPLWKPGSLLCLLCIHFPLPSHLPQRDGEFFFLVPALRARERQSTRHQIKSLELSGLGARPPGAPLCVLACLSGPLGDTTPEEAWPCPSTTREGWTQACRRPYLFR